MNENTLIKVTVKSTEVEYSQLIIMDGEATIHDGKEILEGHRTVEQAQKQLAKFEDGVIVQKVTPITERFEIDYRTLRTKGVEKK